MAWYGRDYGERGWGGGYNPRDTGSSWRREQQEGGWSGQPGQQQREWGESGQRETPWSGRSGRPRGWSDLGNQEELGGRYGARQRPRERMTLTPSEEYDRDMREQLREGWHDLKRGVRRAFGGEEYDEPYRGRGWGGGRFEEDRFEADRFERDRFNQGRGWRTSGRQNPGSGSERQYGSRWQSGSGRYDRGLDRDRFW